MDVDLRFYRNITSLDVAVLSKLDKVFENAKIASYIYIRDPRQIKKRARILRRFARGKAYIHCEKFIHSCWFLIGYVYFTKFIQSPQYYYGEINHIVSKWKMQNKGEFKYPNNYLQHAYYYPMRNVIKGILDHKDGNLQQYAKL